MAVTTREQALRHFTQAHRGVGGRVGFVGAMAWHVHAKPLLRRLGYVWRGFAIVLRVLIVALLAIPAISLPEWLTSSTLDAINRAIGVVGETGGALPRVDAETVRIALIALALAITVSVVFMVMLGQRGRRTSNRHREFHARERLAYFRRAWALEREVADAGPARDALRQTVAEHALRAMLNQLQLALDSGLDTYLNVSLLARESAGARAFVQVARASAREDEPARIEFDEAFAYWCAVFDRATSWPDLDRRGHGFRRRRVGAWPRRFRALMCVPVHAPGDADIVVGIVCVESSKPFYFFGREAMVQREIDGDLVPLARFLAGHAAPLDIAAERAAHAITADDIDAIDRHEAAKTRPAAYLFG